MGIHRSVEESEALERAAIAAANKLKPVLRSYWLYYNKGVTPDPLVIPGDSSRQLIAFFKTATGGDVNIIPISGTDNAQMMLFQTFASIELRLASHGPMITDQFTIDSLGGGGECSILIVTLEGGG